MGIISGHLFLFKACDLSFAELLCILDGRREESGLLCPGSDSSPRRPAIDIDARQVGYKYNKVATGPAGSIYNIAVALSKSGIDVTVVDDAPMRHHSKRAAIERRSERERSHLKCIQLKAQLAEMLQRGEKPSSEEVKLLEKQITQHRSRCESELPENFSEILQRLIQKHEDVLPNHGNLQYVKDDKCQADILLAKRAKERLSDAIFSSDSDFAAHLGDDGLFVKDFSFHSQEQTFSDIVLSATGLRSLNKWIADIKISRPKFPIFQSLKDPMIRALAAVAIGCDVWPGGIKGVGVSKVFKVIQEFSEKPPKDGPAEALAAQLVKCRSSALIDPQVLICFAKAFMYEKSSGGYVHNRPTSLEEYLSDFGDEQTAITKFLPTKTCVGLGCDSQHCFLAAEGFSFCSSCKQIICCHCAGDIRDPGSVLCFPCFRGESVGDEDSVSETEMRSALKQHHVSCPAAASYAEVLDLYSQRVVESKYDIFDDAIKKVKYPLLPTRVLEPSELQLGGPISFIKKLKVAELGFHMQDQTLAMERIQSVVSLLSSLVDFRKEETAMMGLPSAIQGVMPSLIVNFANGARVHSGLRPDEESCQTCN